MSSSYSQSSPGSQYGQVIERTWNASGVMTTDTKTDRTIKWVDSATKGLNPNWRSDIIRGVSATTSLVGERYYIDQWTPGEVQASRPAGTTRKAAAVGMLMTHHTHLPADPTALDISVADNVAKMRFVSDLQSAQTLMQGMVSAGEIGRTLRMLRRPALALRKGFDDYFKSVKKRTSRAPKRSWGNIAGASWLEASFGWGQLFRDVRSANDALGRIRESNYTRVPLKGYGENGSSTSSKIGYANGGIQTVAFIDDIRHVGVIYRGATKCVPVSPSLMPARTFGFSLEEFVPTIWELIPYSFLVDYFTNIGNVIQGWSWQRSGLAWSQRTYRKSRTLATVVHPNRDQYYPKSGTSTTEYRLNFSKPSISRVTRTSVDRQNYTGAFIPNVTFELPVGNKIQKLLNVAGLLAIRRL